MYAGAIFIQQSLHVNLYLAVVGLLAVTALYTIAGTTGRGVMLEVMGRGCGPPHLFLARLLMLQCAKALSSWTLNLLPWKIWFLLAIVQREKIFWWKGGFQNVPYLHKAIFHLFKNFSLEPTQCQAGVFTSTVPSWTTNHFRFGAQGSSFPLRLASQKSGWWGAGPSYVSAFSFL